MSAPPTPKSSPPSPKNWAKNSSATVRATDRRQGFVSILHSDGANLYSLFAPQKARDISTHSPRVRGEPSGNSGNRFSIHTKLHRSKTYNVGLLSLSSFSIHTKLHRSKLCRCLGSCLPRLVSIRNYIALKPFVADILIHLRLVSIRNYIALKPLLCL